MNTTERIRQYRLQRHGRSHGRAHRILDADASMHRVLTSRFATPSLVLALIVGSLLLTMGLADSPRPGLSRRPEAFAQSEWRRIDIGPGVFSIELPPGWEYRPLVGIDSFAGNLVGDGVEVLFDYGAYSGPLAEEGAAGYEFESTHISCRAAEIVVATTEPAKATGVYFPVVRRYRGEVPPPGGEVTGLNVVGFRLEPDQRPIVLRMIRSIRFDDLCVHTDSGFFGAEDLPLGHIPFDVEIISEDEVWAVGMHIDPALGETQCSTLRYSFGAWNAVPCPAKERMIAVDLTSSESGWAVGEHTILRLDEGEWTVYSDTVGSELYDVSMVDETDGWIGGEGTLLRFVDGHWTPYSLDGHNGALSIDMYSREAGFLVTDDVFPEPDQRVFSWRDERWSSIPWPFDGMMQLREVEAGTSGDTWFVGGRGPTPEESFVARYHDDGSFERHDVLDIGQLQSVVDVGARAGDAGEMVWAVGGNLSGELAGVLRYMDGRWESFELPFRGALFSLDMFSMNNGWAAGATIDDEWELEGTIIRFRSNEPEKPFPPRYSGTPTPEPTSHAAPSETPSSAGGRVFLPSVGTGAS